MTIQTFTCNPFQTNGYVVHDGAEAALVDAPYHNDAEQEQLLRYLEARSLAVRHLLLTHAHIDHIFGCAYLAEHFGLGWQMHRADAPFLTRAEEQARFFGMPIEAPPAPASFLKAGDVVELGAARYQVLHTPGHSPGSVCFYDAEGACALTGDVLFAGSIGRTDLFQGSLPTLMQSIYQKLLPLGDDVVVYPGHGPHTTLGRERTTNPFLTGEMGRV